MSSCNRRNSILKVGANKDGDNTTDITSKLNRRVSFKGKSSVREFYGENEPKEWNNSYEVSDAENVSSGAGAEGLGMGGLVNVHQKRIMLRNRRVVFEEKTNSNRKPKSRNDFALDKENMNIKFTDESTELANFDVPKIQLETHHEKSIEMTLLSNEKFCKDHDQRKKANKSDDNVLFSILMSESERELFREGRETFEPTIDLQRELSKFQNFRNQSGQISTTEEEDITIPSNKSMIHRELKEIKEQMDMDVSIEDASANFEPNINLEAEDIAQQTFSRDKEEYAACDILPKSYLGYVSMDLDKSKTDYLESAMEMSLESTHIPLENNQRTLHLHDNIFDYANNSNISEKQTNYDLTLSKQANQEMETYSTVFKGVDFDNTNNRINAIEAEKISFSMPVKSESEHGPLMKNCLFDVSHNTSLPNMHSPVTNLKQLHDDIEMGKISVLAELQKTPVNHRANAKADNKIVASNKAGPRKTLYFTNDPLQISPESVKGKKSKDSKKDGRHMGSTFQFNDSDKSFSLLENTSCPIRSNLDESTTNFLTTYKQETINLAQNKQFPVFESVKNDWKQLTLKDNCEMSIADLNLNERNSLGIETANVSGQHVLMTSNKNDAHMESGIMELDVTNNENPANPILMTFSTENSFQQKNRQTIYFSEGIICEKPMNKGNSTPSENNMEEDETKCDTPEIAESFPVQLKSREIDAIHFQKDNKIGCENFLGRNEASYLAEEEAEEKNESQSLAAAIIANYASDTIFFHDNSQIECESNVTANDLTSYDRKENPERCKYRNSIYFSEDNNIECETTDILKHQRCDESQLNQQKLTFISQSKPERRMSLVTIESKFDERISLLRASAKNEEKQSLSPNNETDENEKALRKVSGNTDTSVLIKPDDDKYALSRRTVIFNQSQSMNFSPLTTEVRRTAFWEGTPHRSVIEFENIERELKENEDIEKENEIEIETRTKQKRSGLEPMESEQFSKQNTNQEKRSNNILTPILSINKKRLKESPFHSFQNCIGKQNAAKRMTILNAKDMSIESTIAETADGLQKSSDESDIEKRMSYCKLGNSGDKSILDIESKICDSPSIIELPRKSNETLYSTMKDIQEADINCGSVVKSQPSNDASIFAVSQIQISDSSMDLTPLKTLQGVGFYPEPDENTVNMRENFTELNCESIHEGSTDDSYITTHDSHVAVSDEKVCECVELVHSNDEQDIIDLSEECAEYVSAKLEREVSLCRKCRGCQKTFIANESASVTTSSFALPTMQPFPILNFESLQLLSKRPTLKDVHEHYRRVSLEQRLNITKFSDDKWLLPSDDAESDENYEGRNIIENNSKMLKRFEEEITKNAPLYLLSIFESFVSRITKCLSGNSTNWIINTHMQHRKLLLFNHSRMLTFSIILMFEERENIIEVSGVQFVCNSVFQKKNWKPIDFLMHNQLELELNTKLPSLSCGDNVQAVLEFLKTFDELCVDIAELSTSLWRLVVLEQASLERNGDRIFVRKIVRKICSETNEYPKVIKSHFVVEVTNIRKVCYKDIVSPALFSFHQDVQFLPSGLDFLHLFLSKPKNYLRK